jgi:hypothetical protein
MVYQHKPAHFERWFHFKKHLYALVTSVTQSKMFSCFFNASEHFACQHSHARHVCCCVQKCCYKSVHCLFQYFLVRKWIAKRFTNSSKRFWCEVILKNEHMFCSWLHRVCTWPCMSSGLATKLTLTRVSRGRLRELGWTCFRSLFCTVICVCCWLIGNTVYLLVRKVTSKAGKNFCDLLLVPYISMYREGPAWKEISCLCRRRYYCEMFSVSYIHQRWSISISLSLITDWTTGVRFVAQTKDIVYCSVCTQTSSKAYPASYPIGARGPLPGCAPGRDTHHSPNLMPK